MQTLDNSKIESKAINTLETVIDEHATMQYDFKRGDKDMSWDGSISLFTSQKNFGKKTFDDKVSVQIKGHLDDEKKYINKKRITYPVDLADLRVFFNDRGVLYFHIFMTTDGKKKEVFYSSLYPSRIKGYLDTAERKGNTESISIVFTKLEKDAQKLYYIVKQFSMESLTQGSGRGQIVPLTIMQKDLDKVESFTASVVGAKDEFEFIERLSSGDVCFYETKEHAPFKIPIEWQDGTIFAVTHKINQTLGLSDKVYYDNYEIESTSEGEKTLILSENLKMRLTKGKFDFKAQSKIEVLRKDAEFLLNALDTSTLLIQGHPFAYGTASMPEELESELRYYVELSDVLREIEFEYNRPYREFTSEIKKELLNLVWMKRGKFNAHAKGKVNPFQWKLEEKYVPLFVMRQEGTEENKLTNALYTTEQAIFVGDEKGVHYKVPLFSHLKPDVLANLYEYKYGDFYDQIDSADVNGATVNNLNYAALDLISAYDINHDEEFLRIAGYLLEKMEELEDNKPYYLINRFQIKKRLGTFSEEDRKRLESLKCTEPDIRFGISVLLGDKENARKYYSSLKKKEKENLKQFPIWSLYDAIK